MRVQNQTKYITTPIIIGTHKTTNHHTTTIYRRVYVSAHPRLSVFCWPEYLFHSCCPIYLRENENPNTHTQNHPSNIFLLLFIAVLFCDYLVFFAQNKARVQDYLLLHKILTLILFYHSVIGLILFHQLVSLQLQDYPNYLTRKHTFT